MNIALIVHGGAGNIAPDLHAEYMAGCREAALTGFGVLQKTDDPFEAVEAAVVLMEDNPVFDAGIGAHLNRAGRAELDAGIMDGDTLQLGALVGVERLQNPIRVARHLLADDVNVLAGRGAEAYAAQNGFALCNPADLIVPAEMARWQRAAQNFVTQGGALPANAPPMGTVGAVAINSTGHIVAGTSTGGTLFKPVGRVGDTPLPGCGFFADSHLAGVSGTGHGESIMRVQLARTAADFCARLPAPAAAQAAVAMLAGRVDGRGGLIMIDHAGRVGLAHNTAYMAWACQTGDMTGPKVGIKT